jgi:hypothetical protein
MTDLMPATAFYNVTCHTENCENANITILVEAMKVDPVIVCGPCGVQITDVVLYVPPTKKTSAK